MGRSTVEGALLANVKTQGFKMESANITLAGALTLADNYPDLLYMDPGGAHRNVTAPTASEANEGRVWIIYNSADAAENLVIKNPSATTLITIGQGKAGMLINMKGNWIGLLGS